MHDGHMAVYACDQRIRQKGGRQLMGGDLTLEAVCAPSEDIVAREIEGEIIIVPLVAGVGDVDDELYSLNETGNAIWQRLDGERSLRQVAALVAADYASPLAQIEDDVLGFAAELTRRRILTRLA
jgi:hypothetical protein